MARITRKRLLEKMEGKRHDARPRHGRKRRVLRAKWYPVECGHGYDCCPACDGPRRDPRTLRVVD